MQSINVGEQSGSTGSSRPTRKRSAADVDEGGPARKTTTPQPQQQAQQPTQPESDEDYAHRTFTQVFRVTVDPHHMSNQQGQRLVFLPNLNQELNESSEPLKLSTTVLDQAIIEACSNWNMAKPLLEYLLPCWKRAVKAATAAKNPTPAREEIHEEAKRLCMSNCLFALTMPALYGFVVAFVPLPFFGRLSCVLALT